MDTAVPVTRPLRVLHVTEASGGGVRRHLQRIVPELRHLQVDVDVLLGTGRAEPGLEGDLACYRGHGCRTAVFASAGTLATLVHGIPALRRTARIWRPDVVHLHATRAGLVGRLAWWLPGRPAIVYSPHAFAFQAPGSRLYHWLAGRMEQRLLGVTDAVVCVSTAERDSAVSVLSVGAQRIHVIENGLEACFRRRLLPAPVVRAEWGIPPERTVIGFCGRLVPQKDLATVLRALAGCRDRFPQAVLVVCGSGPQETALRQLAGCLGLEASVWWNGFVPDLPQRLLGMDLLVLPSRYEGLSYALLEALAAGIPVLAADIPANLPRQNLRGAISLVRPGDPEAWSAALNDALGALAALRAQAAAAAPHVLHEFSARRQAEGLARLYATLSAPARA